MTDKSVCGFQPTQQYANVALGNVQLSGNLLFALSGSQHGLHLRALIYLREPSLRIEARTPDNLTDAAIVHYSEFVGDVTDSHAGSPKL